jgi:LL-diaminopimelate aminotransferase
MKRNPFFLQLSPNYLFRELKNRVDNFALLNPERSLISLGVGDTTEPLGTTIAESLSQAACDMRDQELYMGYGPDQGLLPLREKIASVLYQDIISPDEVFVSDGAKCDIARLQVLFGQDAVVYIQDPSYPAYADSSRLARSIVGKEGHRLSYLSTLPEKDTLPHLEAAPEDAIIFLCSPNNPTGVAFQRSELSSLVDIAQRKNQLIVYDVAYRAFIQGDLPRSIYEIEGAKKCAIEIGSFSKMAGFSGIRLGWTVVPKDLTYSNGITIHSDFLRLVTTTFNGASILSQRGGIQALSPEGLEEIERQILLYLENAGSLKEALLKKNFIVSGGEHSPYVWIKTEHTSSWDAFDYFLQETGIIVTPGIGFGPSGEGHVRISGFGRPYLIESAIRRIESL